MWRSILSGATLVHDVGFLDCAQIGSLEMLVVNEPAEALAGLRPLKYTHVAGVCVRPRGRNHPAGCM